MIRTTKFNALLILIISVILFFSSDPVSARTARVDVYYSPSCQHCRTITDQFLPQMQAKYPGAFSVRLIDITLPENQGELFQMEQIYRFRYLPPTVIIEGIVLARADRIKREFEPVLLGLMGQPAAGMGFKGTGSIFSESKPREKIEPVPISSTEKFESFSFLPIATAGLLDGINPCAFTTIVFFISFLGFAGYQRRQIRWIGIFFILSVFLTYLLIGFGLLRFLHTLQIFPFFSKGLIWLMALFTAFLSFFSFRDYWIFRKTGQTRDWLLQLPLSIKQRIHRVIGDAYRSEGGSSRSEGTGSIFSESKPREKIEPVPFLKTNRPLFKLVLTALITGFSVSSLESICTGQLYVPTLVYMTRLKETTFQAWGYLLLYNIAFIVPLVIVFLLSLFGMTSQQFGQWAQKHLAGVKLGTAFFFLAMTVILVTTVL